MIRVAIQAKGRLNEETVELMSEIGITVADGKRKLLTRSNDFPIEILFLRDDDIPQAVAMGVADLGIVGLNEVEERCFAVDGDNSQVEVVKALGFGKCRLSLAIPKTDEYCGVGYFNGKRVATSYPAILSRYFFEQGIKADICTIAGSVEIAPTVGMAEAIFDIVSSGGTLVSNGLQEIEEVLSSEAVLISRRDLSDENRKLLNQLLFRFEAVERSRGMKYILLNIPESRINEAIALLPGMKSPTIVPLAQEGWKSLQAVVCGGDLWDKVEGLKAIGAQDILVLSLEKMVV